MPDLDAYNSFFAILRRRDQHIERVRITIALRGIRMRFTCMSVLLSVFMAQPLFAKFEPKSLAVYTKIQCKKSQALVLTHPDGDAFSLKVVTKSRFYSAVLRKPVHVELKSESNIPKKEKYVYFDGRHLTSSREHKITLLPPEGVLDSPIGMLRVGELDSQEMSVYCRQHPGGEDDVYIKVNLHEDLRVYLARKFIGSCQPQGEIYEREVRQTLYFTNRERNEQGLSEENALSLKFVDGEAVYEEFATQEECQLTEENPTAFEAPKEIFEVFKRKVHTLQ